MVKGKRILLKSVMSAAVVLSHFALLQPLATTYAAGDVFCVVPLGAATGPFAACDGVTVFFPGIFALRSERNYSTDLHNGCKTCKRQA
jgi:hypothetical protein